MERLADVPRVRQLHFGVFLMLDDGQFLGIFQPDGIALVGGRLASRRFSACCHCEAEQKEQYGFRFHYFCLNLLQR